MILRIFITMCTPNPKTILVFLWIFFSVPNLFAQTKVGLVLSGGGAKGLAHIGVLKALEENNIPIDYIVGTSMGAIVGGMYAGGYSPEEIERIAVTEEFQRWVSGVLEKKYDTYYYKRDEDASLVNIDLSLDTNANSRINTYLVNDAPLNFALNQLLAQASERSKYNFDSLFIPFRCVAADIYSQNQVILKSGSLADALKASSTVPMVYTPIKIENKYLFDGGIYNNFPGDVLSNVFNPDVIIGVNVSSIVSEEYPYNNDERIINNPLKYLLVTKTKPEAVGENGFFVQPNLKKYSAFDFSKAKEMSDSGYASVQVQMGKIKSQIDSRSDSMTIAQKRARFKNGFKPLIFGDIEINGLLKHQEDYIRSEFPSKKTTMTLAVVKKTYFRLINQGSFQSIYPKIRYDSTKQKFIFGMDVQFNKRLSLDVGALISSRNVNYLYLGFNFKYIRWAAFNIYANAYLGRFYQSFQFKAKIDFPYDFNFNFEPEVVINSWNYYRNYDFYFGAEPPKYVTQIDRKYGLNVGFPFGFKKGKATIFGGYIFNQDLYANYDQNIGTADTPDQTIFDGLKLKASFAINTLNRKQYATQGNYLGLSGNYIAGNENYLPGTTAKNPSGLFFRQWFKLKLSHEKYQGNKFVSFGYLVEAVYSNQPLFSNYRSTLLSASAFTPLQDGKTFFLENFRSISYAAGGVKLIITPVRNLDLRIESYVFNPLNLIVQDPDQKATYTENYFNYRLLVGASVIYHTGFGPLALAANYYPNNFQELGVFLHFGYLLFNQKSLE